MNHSRNRCCVMMWYNFFMLKACNIKLKLRVIFQFTQMQFEKSSWQKKKKEKKRKKEKKKSV